MRITMRQGLYRETIAGAVWLLPRLRGCMPPEEILGELRRLGLDTSRSTLHRVLREYTGRLFERTRNGGRILYCAIREV